MRIEWKKKFAVPLRYRWQTDSSPPCLHLMPQTRVATRRRGVTQTPPTTNPNHFVPSTYLLHLPPLILWPLLVVEEDVAGVASEPSGAAWKQHMRITTLSKMRRDESMQAKTYQTIQSTSFWQSEEIDEDERIMTLYVMARYMTRLFEVLIPLLLFCFASLIMYGQTYLKNCCIVHMYVHKLMDVDPCKWDGFILIPLWTQAVQPTFVTN